MQREDACGRFLALTSSLKATWTLRVKDVNCVWCFSPSTHQAIPRIVSEPPQLGEPTALYPPAIAFPVRWALYVVVARRAGKGTLDEYEQEKRIASDQWSVQPKYYV